MLEKLWWTKDILHDFEQGRFYEIGGLTLFFKIGLGRIKT